MGKIYHGFVLSLPLFPITFSNLLIFRININFISPLIHLILRLLLFIILEYLIYIENK